MRKPIVGKGKVMNVRASNLVIGFTRIFLVYLGSWFKGLCFSLISIASFKCGNCAHRSIVMVIWDVEGEREHTPSVEGGL